MGVSINPNARYTHTIGTDLALPVSYCGWVRVDTDRNNFTTICWLGDDTSTDHCLLLALNSDGVTPTLYDDDFNEDVLGPALTVGTWYFVAATAATGAGNLRLYVVAEGGTLALTDSAQYQTTFDGELIGIGGGRPDGEGVALNADASFAYWRFWTAALSLAELQAEMASATPVRTSNLYASYRFENTSNHTVDGSGNGRNLTATTGTGSFANTDDPDLGGGADVTGSATLSAGGSLTAAGVPGVVGSSALSAGGTLSATGVRGRQGTAALAGGGSLTGSGVPGVVGAASATAGGTLTATGVRSTTGTGSLVAGGTLAAAGQREVDGTGSLSGGGQLAAAGVRSTAGAAALSAGGTLTGAGVRGVTGSVGLAGGGTLTASGTVEGVVAGAATLSAGGSLAGVGRRGVVGVATATSGGSLSAIGVRGRRGSAVLAAGGSLTAIGETPAAADPNPTIVRVRDSRIPTLADRGVQRLRETA